MTRTVRELLAVRDSHEALAELLELGPEAVTPEVRWSISFRYWTVSEIWLRSDE